MHTADALLQIYSKVIWFMINACHFFLGGVGNGNSDDAYSKVSLGLPLPWKVSQDCLYTICNVQFIRCFSVC